MVDNRSDGQHRSDGSPVINNGQRTRISPDVKTGLNPGHGMGAYVGQKSGGEEHGGSRTRSVPLDTDISTTTHSAGVKSPGERPGADDKK